MQHCCAGSKRNCLHLAWPESTLEKQSCLVMWGKRSSPVRQVGHLTPFCVQCTFEYAREEIDCDSSTACESLRCMSLWAQTSKSADLQLVCVSKHSMFVLPDLGSPEQVIQHTSLMLADALKCRTSMCSAQLHLKEGWNLQVSSCWCPGVVVVLEFTCRTAVHIHAGWQRLLWDGFHACWKA